MSKTSFPLILSLIIFILFQACKPEVAQWRGAGRTGIYEETNLLNEWPENGPELLWAYKGIGKGYAAPSLLNDQIFVNGERDSSSFLLAFDLSGKLLWEAPNGKEFMGDGFSATYPGARSTPTVVGDLVYTCSGMGRIACFETETGKEVWALDLIKDFTSFLPSFGFSESFVVDDDKIYCFVGGSKTNMAALDRFNGQTVWSSEAKKDTFSYCNPTLVELPQQKVLITHSKHNLYAVDCNSGNVLGSIALEGVTYDGDHCNSPIYSDGFIYFMGSENKGCGALKFKLSDDAENISQVWEKKKIKNNFNAYIKIEDKLFTTVKGNWLKALNIENGEAMDSIKVATGALIYADNKFICYGMNGEVSLIQNNENKMEVRSTFKVKEGTGHHFAHPLVKDGVLYIRHGNALLAYRIK
jgi:outer membrane protein assembly factor BamB